MAEDIFFASTNIIMLKSPYGVSMTKRIQTAYLFAGLVRVIYEDGTQYSFDGGIGYEIENYTATSIVMIHRKDAQRRTYDSEGHYISSDYAHDIARENYAREQEERERNKEAEGTLKQESHNITPNNTCDYEFGNFIGDLFNALDNAFSQSDEKHAEQEKKRNLQQDIKDRINKIQEDRHKKILSVNKILKGKWF